MLLNHYVFYLFENNEQFNIYVCDIVLNWVQVWRLQEQIPDTLMF